MGTNNGDILHYCKFAIMQNVPINIEGYQHCGGLWSI